MQPLLGGQLLWLVNTADELASLGVGKVVLEAHVLLDEQLIVVLVARAHLAPEYGMLVRLVADRTLRQFLRLAVSRGGPCWRGRGGGRRGRSCRARCSAASFGRGGRGGARDGGAHGHDVERNVRHVGRVNRGYDSKRLLLVVLVAYESGEAVTVHFQVVLEPLLNKISTIRLNKVSWKSRFRTSSLIRLNFFGCAVTWSIT